MWNNSLYGNFRTRKFTDIWDNADDFYEDVCDCGLGIDTLMSEAELKRVYYLLYSYYGNSHIASSDENQFKYKAYAVIFEYGPYWAKNLQIQTNLRAITDAELLEGAKTIYNHAFNPSTTPGTSTTEELNYINEQNTTNYKRNKLDAYGLLLELLRSDLTKQFMSKFKSLFLVIVTPEMPLWYVSNDTEEDENEDLEV